MEVKLDKALYREVYQSFKYLNDFDMRPHANKLSGWTQFVDLWEFGWQMGVKQTLQQQTQKWRRMGIVITPTSKNLRRGGGKMEKNLSRL